MPSISTSMLAAAILIAVALASAPLAQEQPQPRPPVAASPLSDDAETSPTDRPLTGKERLTRKWMDEQRADNCKVPLDKRGPLPRPDCTVPPTRQGQ
jgi:hypothetical protein